jgi:hypothetical protein
MTIQPMTEARSGHDLHRTRTNNFGGEVLQQLQQEPYRGHDTLDHDRRAHPDDQLPSTINDVGPLTRLSDTERTSTPGNSTSSIAQTPLKGKSPDETFPHSRADQGVHATPV